MAHSSLINVILLCIVNGVFIFAGTTLNTLVILCLWKSSQLRKKLCYFFILILSCCDLIVVIVSHPLIICLALTWAIEDRRMLERKNIFRWINNFLVGFASITLLTMNIERYLSTAHPLFHRRSVTKRRLVALLALLQVVDFVFTIVQVFLPIICSIVVILILLALISVMNYKMFMIAMVAKRNGNRRSAVNFKTASTCLLAVLCLFFSSIPLILYFFFEIFSTFNDDVLVSYYLWAVTAVTMDSTFNCFLFFWRNKILRAEGVKILNRFRFGTSRVNPA